MTVIPFLLWSTQGVREWRLKNALRTVPSAGNRHTLETYLVVFNVGGLEPGMYRYLPSQHQLVLESTADHLKDRLIDADRNQQSADQLLNVDGDEEFVVYMAPVGKI
ncbi:MAG: hypothetical protein ABGU93_01520 [Acetobacterium sp.]|uniref:hypothetical protein n=1 Tax=Acetobacterium sp. TaxID=1872094 RepID=UPI003242F0E9